jgi:uncharacterized protein (TIGR02453 family)
MPKLAEKPSANFSGFAREAPGFFHELAAEMNKDWFEANKARYQALWVEPMTALLTELSARIAKSYAPMKLGAPKLFRIYRDTRFSKDKSPYKTHVAGLIPMGAKKPVEGGGSPIYMHVGIDEEWVGCGTYFFDDKQLAKWRKLVAADKTGKEIAGIVSKLRKAGYSVGGHEDYKKVPKPYAEDHPRAEFLKIRGLTAGFPDMPRGMLHDAKLLDWLTKHAKATAPMVVWLRKHL